MTNERVSDAEWLEEAARYFENRSTGGEDMAFWANVTNAERCRSIALSLRSAREAEPVGILVPDGEDGLEPFLYEGANVSEGDELYVHPSPSTEGLGVRGVIERAAQIAGDACWNRPMPKNWDRDKAEHSEWCAEQSRFVREKILALSAPSTSAEQVSGQPMEGAPHDRPILVWWPIVLIDEETYDLSDTEVDGAWLVTEWNGGCWLEPDVLNALNSAAFDDDREYARTPRCWLELPAALSPIPDNQVEG